MAFLIRLRGVLSQAIFVLAIVGAVVAAAAWEYVIWGAEHGGFGTRSFGLWLLGLSVGAIFVFLGVLALGGWLSSVVSPD